MTINKIQDLKTFVSESGSVIENKFSKIDGAKIESIEEERFYSYLEMIKEEEGKLDSKISELEKILSYLKDISEKSNSQIKSILKNEKAKIYYHLFGKTKTSNSEYMDIVSANNFVFSIKDKGWTFEWV